MTTDAADETATTSSASLSPLPPTRLRVRRRQEAAQPTIRDSHRDRMNLEGGEETFEIWRHLRTRFLENVFGFSETQLINQYGSLET